MAVHNESFRVRVVDFLRKGHTYRETAEIFGVSVGSICTWNKIAKKKKLNFAKSQ